MEIRQATSKDLPAIKALIKLYPKQLMQTHLPRSADFFLAENENGVIGCCALQVYSRRIAEIRSLVVHPSFQKKGIAGKLLRRCLRRAKTEKIHEVFSVTGSVKLFEHFGFNMFKQEKYAMLKFIT